MGLKTFRPLTPSLRGTVLSDFSEITKRTPEAKLTVAKRRTGGRNNVGRMTARGIGGGHKQRYRIIDFKRDKVGVEATVEAIEYDPNRSARIALLKYKDGEKRYILAPIGLAVGAKVKSGPDAEPSVGNALPLKKIIPGMPIHNIELHRGRGGQICRSAGGAAQLCDGQVAFERDSPHQPRVLRDDRTDWQHRSHQYHAGKGRTEPLAWPARHFPRYGPQPGGSPDGWWSGQEQGRWRMASPVFAVGLAGEGR